MSKSFYSQSQKGHALRWEIVNGEGIENWRTVVVRKSANSLPDISTVLSYTC